MSKWVCKVCGYVHEAPAPPDSCPECGADQSELVSCVEVGEGSPMPCGAPTVPVETRVRTWRCTVCGYEHEGVEPPEVCPECGADRSAFEPVEEPPPASERKPTTRPASRLRCAVCATPLGDYAQSERCPVCWAEGAVLSSGAASLSPRTARSGPERRFVVVGSGCAAVAAAEALRAADDTAEIRVVTRDACLPYDRLNLTRLLAGEIDALDLFRRAPAWYRERRIEVLLDTEATGYDCAAHVVRTHRGPIPYDRLVLATGARPFVPAIANAWLEGVGPLRTIEDAHRIRRRAHGAAKVVVVGGGVLGLETAWGLGRLGCEVSVCEGADHLLPRQLDRDAAAILLAHLERAGLRFVFADTPKAMVGDDSVRGVELASGRILPATLVVVSAGIRPNVADARAAGLAVGQGVVVDDAMRTSDQDVFAAGDGAEHRGILYGIWPASLRMGEVAGASAAGRGASFEGMPPNHVLKVVGLEVVSVGRASAGGDDSRQLVRADRARSRYDKVVFQDGKLAGAIVVGDRALGLRLQKLVQARSECGGAARAEVSDDEAWRRVSEHAGREP